MRRRITIYPAAILAVLAILQPAAAHKPSDSYLTLTVAEDGIEGRWDIALRDLDFAIGLDGNQDGALTWGEVREKHGDIEAYAFSRLVIETPGGRCALSGGAQLIENHSDGAHTVVPFAADCPGTLDRLRIGYRLLFDIDSLHRGLLQIRGGNVTASAVLSPGADSYVWQAGGTPWLDNFLTYVGDGIRHILIGMDHILFLICLLLPAGFRRTGGAWRRVEDWREAVWPVLRIVTAFTLAHSITLGVAAIGLVSLPSRLVESVIAASIVVAALNNVWPVVVGRLWMVAFGFGLIHGFGFASVLSDLGLPEGALALSLLGFNLGVEIGQLAIVAVALPVIYGLRQCRPYPRLILPAGSAATAVISTVWLVERSLQVTFF